MTNTNDAYSVIMNSAKTPLKNDVFAARNGHLALITGTKYNSRWRCEK
jgi:hypothetical protein